MGLFKKYVTEKIDIFDPLPPCHTSPSFVLNPSPLVALQKSYKVRAENKSKFDVNFRPYILLKLAYAQIFFLHKTYLDGQLHQNVNEMMIT